MSWQSCKEHVRNNRVMDRIVFTLLLVIMGVNMVTELRSGVDIEFWVFLILTVLYVPLTLMAWFLPDEDTN